MLLRWIVNQYLRDAAEGKVRHVVAGVLQPTAAPVEPKGQVTELPSERPAERRGDDDEFLPCDAAIVFALGIESGGLVDLLKSAERSRQPHGTEHAGKLAGREVVIVDGGVGSKAAARATSEVIRFYRPKWVISTGFAGALDQSLRRGHIVMADEIVSGGGQRLRTGLQLDPAMAAQTRGLHVGRLLTVEQLVRTPQERKRLAAEHGAIACDMETFGVAEACQQFGMRMLSVRIISDAVDDELPPEIEHLLAQKTLAGKLGAAGGAILRRPAAVKDLWQLREDALKASDRLAKFLVGVVEQLDAG